MQIDGVVLDGEFERGSGIGMRSRGAFCLV